METKTYEVKVPVLDVSRGLIIEVLENGSGDVLMNGVVLAGAKLVGWTLNRFIEPIYSWGYAQDFVKYRDDRYTADIIFGGGEATQFHPKLLVITKGSVPTVRA